MTADLVHELHRFSSRHGGLTICEGGGMANAATFERL
jgi:acetyl-CoA acetyltransferase